MRVICHEVKDAKFAEYSKYEEQKLYVNIEEITAYCLEGVTGYELEFQWAKPGDEVRVVHITDTVAPVYKEEGSTFQGILEGEHRCGKGKTVRLEGIAVMQSFKYPGIQEGIVDMAGEGSKYSVFSQMINLVMVVSLAKEDITKSQIANDLNKMNLRCAEFLGRLAQRISGGIVEEVSTESFVEGLLNVGYAYFIQAQGPLRNVHIYGEDCTKMEPRIMAPEEIIDGALISGNYIIACQKNPTYFHQKNPVIEELLRRHGKELNFKCVILSTEGSLLETKKSNCDKIAHIAKEQGLDGIIVTQEGGGHADVDLMMTIDACQKVGIATVIQTNEIAGAEGALPSLVASSEYADAIITNGNNDEVIVLDEMKYSIGGNTILAGKYDALQSFETSLGILYTSTNQLGANSMKTKTY